MLLKIAVILFFAVLYTNGANIKTEEKKCGLVKEGGLIKNESVDATKQAGFGEFPFVVALLKGGAVTCAGSLIQTNLVLTAGHCVKDVKKEELKIKAGLWDINGKNEQHPVQERSVSEIIKHAEFSNEDKAAKNDIALIVLEKPVELADHIGLACLAGKDHEEKSKKCYAAGWGKEGKEGKSTNVMKKLLLPVVAKDDCEKKLKEKQSTISLTDKTICAGGDKVATCMGDGGAPLVCQIEPENDNKGRFVQSGITSWGIGCANELPGVYTNVAKYRQWIDEQVTKLKLDTKNYTV